MVSARRRPAYLSREPARQDRWLASYADVITILLVLFIAAAAKGVAQHAEVSHVAAKSSSAFGAPWATAALPAAARTARDGPPENSPVPRPVVSGLSPSLMALQAKLRGRNADMRIEQRGIVISLPQAVLFPPGQARIDREALSLVEEIADAIRSIPNRISLIGHTDGTPIRNKRFRSNWELSVARSVELLETLTREFGIREDRLSVASFGPYQPKTTNGTREGRAENRRVEIIILPE